MEHDGDQRRQHFLNTISDIGRRHGWKTAATLDESSRIRRLRSLLPQLWPQLLPGEQLALYTAAKQFQKFTFFKVKLLLNRWWLARSLATQVPAKEMSLAGALDLTYDLSSLVTVIVTLHKRGSAAQVMPLDERAIYG